MDVNFLHNGESVLNTASDAMPIRNYLDEIFIARASIFSVCGLLVLEGIGSEFALGSVSITCVFYGMWSDAIQ